MRDVAAVWVGAIHVAVVAGVAYGVFVRTARAVGP